MTEYELARVLAELSTEEGEVDARLYGDTMTAAESAAATV